MADIKYIITADAGGAVSSIKQVEGAISGMKTQAEKSKSPVAGLWKQVAAGIGVVVGVRQAIKGMVGFMKDAVASAAEQELAEKNLAVALESTGRSVEDMLPHLKSYASELQSQTVYSDEAINSAQALLIQLTNLDQKGLDEATKGAIGMASVFKVDLASATNIVAKALAGNYGALSRYGIKVDENLSKAEKQSQLLEKLAVLYERAKGETDTFAGATKQLSNMWDEVKEAFGNAIIKNESLQKGIKDLSEWVKKLSESEDFKLWLDVIVSGLIKAIELVGKFAGGIKDLTEKVFALGTKNKELAEAQEKLNAALERAKAAGHDYGAKLEEIKANAERLKETTKLVKEEQAAFTKEIETAIQKTSGVVVATSAFEAEVLSLTRVLDGAQDELDEWSNGIVGVARDLSDVANQALPELESEAYETTQNVRNYWDDMADGLQTKWASTIGEVLRGATSLKDGLKGIWDAIVEQFTDMIGQMIAKWVVDFLGGILSETASAAKDIVGAVAKTAASVLSGGLSDIIGGALGGLISGLVGGKGGLDTTSKWHLEHIWLNTQALKEWVSLNAQARLNEIATFITHGNEKLDQTNIILNGIRRVLKDIAKDISKIPSGQGGLDFYSSNRAGIVRYHPYERVTVQPVAQPSMSMNLSSTPVNVRVPVYIDRRKIMEIVSNDSIKWSAKGRMKFHERGLTDKR